MLFFFIFFTSLVSWSDERLLRVENHLHTQDDSEYVRNPDPRFPEKSYSSKGLQALIQRARDQKVDVLMITEHNTFAHCFDPVFGASHDGVLLICGSEWTSARGFHLNIYFPTPPPKGFHLTPDNPRVKAKEDEVANVVTKVHALGGYVSLNHPGMPFYQPSSSLGVDFVEALLPAYALPNAALSWWTKELLRSGRPLAGIACSDYHVGASDRELFDAPIAVVRAEQNAKSVLDAISEGRSLMIDSAQQTMGLDVTLSSASRRVLVGQTLEGPTQSQMLTFEVKTSKAVGSTLLVTMNGSILYKGKVTYDGQAVSLQVLPPEKFSFLRAELRDMLNIPSVVTNPIYIKPD